MNEFKDVKKLRTHSESFSLAGSFINHTKQDPDQEDTTKSTFNDLWSNQRLKINLISSCCIWLLSSFNFYLITFYLKSFPGSIYLNSACFAGADMIAFLTSGIVLNRVTIRQGLSFSYSISMISGLFYLLIFKQAENSDVVKNQVIPIVIGFCRIGGSMSFNIGYISVARLFPTEFVSTVFGIVNFVSHIITIGAPMVAELSQPIPMTVFMLNAFVAIFAAMGLVEISKK